MNRPILFLLIFLAFFTKAQIKNQQFGEAMKKMQSADYEAGIKLLDQVILQSPNDYPALYNRAVAKSILRKYEAALLDINKAILAKSDAKKAYLQKGIILKKLTEYEKAATNFDLALKIDPKFPDALYNKGVLFEYLGQFEEACVEFRKAKDVGSAAAYPKVDFCETPLNQRTKTNSILKLEEITTDKSYGFSQKNPVKVGTGSNGGLENEQTYLDLLRDETGQPILYFFKKRCCDYFSKNAIGGKGFLNEYEITYKLKNGTAKSSTLYLNQTEYSKPLILTGFGTVKPQL